MIELLQENIAHIGVAFLHEKYKPTQSVLPKNIAYFSGLGVEDLWINYPWDAVDIDEHNREASMYKK